MGVAIERNHPSRCLVYVVAIGDVTCEYDCSEHSELAKLNKDRAIQCFNILW